jgi:hypothetical protein
LQGLTDGEYELVLRSNGKAIPRGLTQMVTVTNQAEVQVNFVIDANRKGN